MTDPERIKNKMKQLQEIMEIDFHDEKGLDYLARAMDATQTVDGCSGANHSNTQNAPLAALGDSLMDLFLVK